MATCASMPKKRKCICVFRGVDWIFTWTGMFSPFRYPTNKTVFIQAKLFFIMWSYLLQYLSQTLMEALLGRSVGVCVRVCLCVRWALKLTTVKQNATVQEGMFIHLMLRANLCLIKIKTRNNTTKVCKKTQNKTRKITTRDRLRAAEKMYKQTTVTLMWMSF